MDINFPMFNTARRKLTLWYVLILMSVSIAFSGVIYRGMALEVERFSRIQQARFERRFFELGLVPPPFRDSEIIREMKQHIILVLLGINGGILVVMGGIAYLLAGKTMQPIQEMIQEQNRFISDASHELKTPLTAMKSSLEVYIRDPKLTLSEAKTVLQDNIEEVNRLTYLSESLLSLSMHKREKDSAPFAKLNMNSVLIKARSLVRHAALQKKIEIDLFQIPEKKIEGNEQKLVELFTILLDNAVKYSSASSHISITGKLGKKGLELRVKDFGIGIHEKDIPHVFDRFYRSDSARSKADAGGYGLGLSIAKKIIELHAGKITLESMINVGTTVIVWLPIRSAHNQHY